MRITNGIMTNNVLNNVLRNTQELYNLQDQLSSGKKISKPSDNPTDISRIMKFNQNISRMGQYESNINSVKVNLDTTDGILFSLTSDLNSVQTTLSQYLNEALSGTARSVLASDIDNLFDSIMQTANSSLNGKYIFGGYNVSSPPFEVVGDKVRYNGTDDQMMVPVGENEVLEGSITGVDLFAIHKMEGVKYFDSPAQALYSAPSSDKVRITVGDRTTDITIGYDATTGMTLQDVADSINQAGVDLNAMVVETESGFRLKFVSKYLGSDGTISLEDDMPGGVFEKFGLLNSDGDFVGIQNEPSGGVLSTILSIKNKINEGATDISEDIDSFNSGRDGVIKAHSLIGIYTKRMELRENYLIDLKIQQQKLTSSLEDVDYTELMMDYNQQMLAYQSALNVGAKIMQPTLIDYL